MKINKIILIIACFTIILSILSSSIYATEFDPTPYKPDSQTQAGGDTTQLKTIGNIIVGVIRTVGSIASVGVLIVLGIKYMAGSIEERAKYKETMVPYVIGAALTFGITNILAVIIDIAGLFG